MRGERRGRVARVRSAVNRQGREEPGERADAAGQTVSDRQGGGLGSVSTGESQQGCGGGRRGGDRAGRGGPGPGSVQDLGPDVVGALLSAPRGGGGEPPSGRARGAGPGWAGRGRPD